MEAQFLVLNVKATGTVLTYRTSVVSVVDGWEIFDESNYWIRLDKVPANIQALANGDKFTIPVGVHAKAHKME